MHQLYPSVTSRLSAVGRLWLPLITRRGGGGRGRGLGSGFRLNADRVEEWEGAGNRGINQPNERDVFLSDCYISVNSESVGLPNR